MADSYVPRMLDDVVAQRMASFPALLVTGPRGTGKTTTAARFSSTILRLDQPEEAAVVEADPDAALATWSHPILIDEWQVVPSVLGAVKRSVDADPQPGRFVITGSVRADLDVATWPGTGRLLRVPMYGLSTRERLRVAGDTTFVDRLVDDGIDGIPVPDDPPDLRGYVAEILVSGFPQPAINLGSGERALWLESYVDQVVTRDAELIDERRDATRLRRYVDALAANTAGVVDEETLLRAAGVNRQTGNAYERLLAGLSLLDLLPAWWTNRIKRLTQRPKRLLVDAALAAAALRIDEHGIMRDADVLGRLLETYVIAQIRAESAASEARPRLHHLRTAQGRHEIDLIAELPGQAVIGIEIKATSTPDQRDAQHLKWLRDEIGQKFIAGVVLHTGRRIHRIDDRIVAAPVASLWGST